MGIRVMGLFWVWMKIAYRRYNKIEEKTNVKKGRLSGKGLEFGNIVFWITD